MMKEDKKWFVVKCGTAYDLVNRNLNCKGVRDIFNRYCTHYKEQIIVFYGKWTDKGFEFISNYRWQDGMIIECDFSTNNYRIKKDFLIGDLENGN